MYNKLTFGFGELNGIGKESSGARVSRPRIWGWSARPSCVYRELFQTNATAMCWCDKVQILNKRFDEGFCIILMLSWIELAGRSGEEKPK